MIQQRNQNKIKENKDKNIIKGKQIKNDEKNKKNQHHMDIQTTNNSISTVQTQNFILAQKAKVQIPKFQFQFDKKDQVEQYQDQIIVYLKQQQKKFKINQHYLKIHKSLNLKIRNFLIKYILKIIWKYKCKRQTQYLAIYLMDFYLSKENNIQNNSQCIVVAQAALFIAMKYQEIYPPPLKNWIVDTDQIKTILQVQSKILKKIEFKINVPSVTYFQLYLQKKFFQTQPYQQNKQNLYFQEQKVHLITDLCLFDTSLYEFQPHDIALNIRKMVYNYQIPFKHERLVLNIKWVIQRSKLYLEWLKEFKYKDMNLHGQ